MMEFLEWLLHFVRNLNTELPILLDTYHNWFYLILFVIIFVETGLVIMPFLPGDSLLFAAGALCAGENELSLFMLIGLLILAAIAGDQTNYWIGRFFGERILSKKIFGRALVAEKHLKKTELFFEKYGTKAIIMARFVPVVRTITPFVAGIGKMDYRSKFFPFDIFGGFLWITSMTIAGYFLGQIEFIQKHFEAVVLVIIVLSILPMIVAALRAKFSSK
ncbi:MAG: VTT domain-containing protein [Bacteroidota bacterium]|jgi:membrane-associated protein